ncbi:MAG: 6-phosphogluconolactonase [Phycisphaeraceae bacterium]|nr:6-phosphogluconolactonase [Phycisphaeraceae bacterium]
MSEIYDVVPRPPMPNLPGGVVLRESPDELIDAMIADLLVHASGCVRAFGDFHLALSGGSTPEPFYRRLMYDPACREFPWKRTHLWIVDERRVPFEDDRSNYKMIRETIVVHSDIPAEQVHPMRATEPDADEVYERALREVLEWREKGHDRLDYVLLGMGTDGHTASLFPNSPALDARDRLIAINAGPTVTPPDRVTMTFPLLNASRFIGVMVTGSGKRATLTKIAARQVGQREMPILGIRPLAGELRWYIDEAACPIPDSAGDGTSTGSANVGGR